MSIETKHFFDNDIVEFRSANLIHAGEFSFRGQIWQKFKVNRFISWKASVDRAFAGECVDYVINCAAETRPGFAESIYEESIYKLGVNCIVAASKFKGLKRFIQLSSCMSSNGNTEVKEDCPVEPWTIIGKQHAKLEQHLKSQKAVKYTIVRLPIVYGKEDRRGLSE